MNRTSQIDRLYPLGDYRNIRFSDTIADIPDKLAMDSEFMAAIRYLQMVEIEITFRRYIELTNKVGTIKFEEAMKILEDLRVETMGKIKATLEEQGVK
jgi:hypothetical protein